jgi:hypothetical protein
MELTASIVRRIFIAAAERVGSLNRLATRLDISQEHIRHFLDGSASPIDSVLLGAVDIAIPDLETLDRGFPSWREVLLQPRAAARQ